MLSSRQLINDSPMKKHVLFFPFCCLLLISTLTGCNAYEALKLRRHNNQLQYENSSQTQAVRIPFTVYNGHIILPVSINGSEPLRIVFDTGAPIPVLFESSRTHQLSFNKTGTLQVGGTGSAPPVKVDVTEENQLTVASLTINDLSMAWIPVSELHLFNSYDETYFDGAIGYDLLRRYRIEIDNQRQELILWEKPISAFDLAGWEAIDLIIESDHIYADTHIEYDGQRHEKVRLLVDTGSTRYLSLNPASHPTMKLPQNGISAPGIGLQGVSHCQNSVITKLTINNLTLGYIPTGFNLSGAVEDGRQGILGNLLLQRFNNLIDYQQSKLYLKPIENTYDPMPVDRSGISILPHVRGAVIMAIKADEVTSNLGLRKGTIITHFMSQQITPHTYQQFWQALRSQKDAINICLGGN